MRLVVRVGIIGALLVGAAVPVDANARNGETGSSAGGVQVIVDADPLTYRTILPVLHREDPPPLTVDAWDDESVGKLMGHIEHRVLRFGWASEILAVGKLPDVVISRLLNLQNEHHAIVRFEPDPWAYARRGLVDADKPIVPVWVADPSMVGLAHHAATVAAPTGEIWVPVENAEQLQRVMDLDCSRIISVGEPPEGAQAQRVDKLEPVALASMIRQAGRGGDACPTEFDVQYTLVAYTGLLYTDTIPAGGNPESFYDSTNLAIQFNQAFPTTTQLLSLASTATPFFVSNPDPNIGGYQDGMEAAVDLAIANAVNAFNSDGCNVQQHLRVTDLFVFSHPMDIPYRRKLLVVLLQDLHGAQQLGGCPVPC